MQTCVEASIDAITSGVKPGGVSTTTKSLLARSSGVELAQELDRHGAGLVGPHRRHQHAQPRLGCGVR